MDQKKYIGMDVHQASISVAVRDAAGKLVTESIIETKAPTILEFVGGIRGSLWITFEEGTSAAWLYDLLKPHVTKVIVCNPRRNALLNAGSKSDRVDARKLSDLLRAGLLTPQAAERMGVVYKARDSRLDRPVAIKILPKEAAANPERKRRFAQEAKAASALNHPNILHLYAIETADGVDYIAI